MSLFVIFQTFTALYSTGTRDGNILNNHHITLLYTGNLVMYKTDGAVEWESGSSGAAQKLILQEDGDLAVVGVDGIVIWSS